MTGHCRCCPSLCASRSQIVYPDAPEFGRSCRFLVVGEAPGAEEDRQGRGFVGRAGRTLHRLLEEQGFHRGFDYGCANIVRCRPPENRKPSAEEVAQCLPYLAETIRSARPLAILLVGGTAVSVFCGSGSLASQIARLRANGHRSEPGFCHPDLRTVLETDAAPNLFAMPHTSPLAWNRPGPDGRKWSEWGKEAMVSMALALKKRGGGFDAAWG